MRIPTQLFALALVAAFVVPAAAAPKKKVAPPTFEEVKPATAAATGVCELWKSASEPDTEYNCGLDPVKVLFCRKPTLRASGANYYFPTQCVASFKEAAHNYGGTNWGENLLKRYFTDKNGHSRYDPSLAHWVIYIDKDGEVHEEMYAWSSLHGKAVKVDRRLSGESQIWVMVFSEINYASATFTTEQLADYRGPGALVVDAIARSLVGNTIAKAPLASNAGVQPTPDAADAETSQALVFHPLGKDDAATSNGEDGSADTASGQSLEIKINDKAVNVTVGGSPLKITMPSKTPKKPEYNPNQLYFASAKSVLNSSTKDRLTVGQLVPNQAPDSLKKVALRNVEENFFNGDAAGFGVSVAGGGTLWSKRLFEPNLFLTAQLYPLKDWDDCRKYWWLGAWNPPGLFVGTNLFNGAAEAGSPGGSFFSEFVTGVVWQPFPISPNISFDFGGNFQAHRKGGKPFLALDYRL